MNRDIFLYINLFIVIPYVGSVALLLLHNNCILLSLTKLFTLAFYLFLNLSTNFMASKDSYIGLCGLSRPEFYVPSVRRHVIDNFIHRKKTIEHRQIIVALKIALASKCRGFTQVYERPTRYADSYARTRRWAQISNSNNNDTEANKRYTPAGTLLHKPQDVRRPSSVVYSCSCNSERSSSGWLAPPSTQQQSRVRSKAHCEYTCRAELLL